MSTVLQSYRQMTQGRAIRKTCTCLHHELVGVIIAPAHDPEAFICELSVKAADSFVQSYHIQVPVLGQCNEQGHRQGVAIMSLQGQSRITARRTSMG